MKNSSKDLQKWGIYLAKFYFEDQPDVYKIRPVVIVDEDKPKVLVLKVTSNLQNAPSLIIEDFESHGLNKPSCILLNRIYLIEKNDIFTDKHLGDLNEAEIEIIINRIKNFNE